MVYGARNSGGCIEWAAGGVITKAPSIVPSARRSVRGIECLLNPLPPETSLLLPDV